MPPKFSYEIDRAFISADSLKNQFRTSPCEAICPAGNPIQKIHGLIEKGNFEEALWYLKAKNPFTGVTGRICPHPCQTECNRSHFDESVAIRALERAAFDHADGSALPRPRRRPATGRTVAVIGGGPAGLSSAYYLSLLGHRVTVLDANPVLGGIPRFGVPDYRLPKALVDREVGWILESGLHVRTNCQVGRDISFQQLHQDYNAIVIAAGTAKERPLNIPGIEQAVKAVEFLRQVNMGFHRNIGEKVVIVGGGGVAFDCAFTARRLGARNVQIICLEACDAMVAPSEDLTQAVQEEIIITNSCSISRVVEKDGHVAGVEYFSVSECFFDETGQAHVKAGSDQKLFVPADIVIVAAGLQTDLKFLEPLCPETSPKGTLKVNEDQATSLSGVFAAGDVVTGPSIVAQAVGSGRRAAFGVHAFLTNERHQIYAFGSDGFIETADGLAGSSPPHIVKFDELFGIYHYQKKAALPLKPLPQISFEERLPGVGTAEAHEESQRCFHCGHCKECGMCVEDCPGFVLERALDDKPRVGHADECWHCANCRTSCPCGAVGFEFPLFMMV
jgi:heterodisulfide reductase subunit A